MRINIEDSTNPHAKTRYLWAIGSSESFSLCDKARNWAITTANAGGLAIHRNLLIARLRQQFVDHPL